MEGERGKGEGGGEGKGGRIGLGVQVGLLPLDAPLGRPPPLSLLYIRGQGVTSKAHQLFLAVCGAPLHRLLLRSYCRSA